MKTIYILLLTFSISLTCISQNYRGLYVNDFKDIIGDNLLESELLTYAQNNNFNYLILYNLTYIHNNIFAIDNATTSIPLSDFIEDAKTNYGILQVAAVGEKNISFDKIKIYNSFHTANPNKQFDVFNLEFEYWNTSLVEPGGYYCNTYLNGNYPCTIDGAIDFYTAQLALMKSYGDENGVLAETYIGYLFRQDQTDGIVANTHRILVHYYRTSDTYNNGNSIYQYPSSAPDRIEKLASPNTTVIMPIFSARPNHMYNWLLTNPLTLPYDTYFNGTNGFNAQTGTWTSQVNFDGYVWYRYSDLLDINNTLSTKNQAFEENHVYYNNISHEIIFENIEKESTIIINDVSGKEIANFELNNTSYHIPNNMLNSIYFIRIKSNRKIWNTKILINQP